MRGVNHKLHIVPLTSFIDQRHSSQIDHHQFGVGGNSQFQRLLVKISAINSIALCFLIFFFFFFFDVFVDSSSSSSSSSSMRPPRRKKWTEEEERTLIEKYGEMVSDGTLIKMKTREKKFRPIAAQVNSLHHSRDPVAFPWQWSWKDASTKVQNMRHQYLLVKQKIKKNKKNPTLNHQQQHHHEIEDEEEEVDEEEQLVEEEGEEEEEEEDEFDWSEGLTHWPNFLRYKSVFGDVPLGGFHTDSINRESCRNFVVGQGSSNRSNEILRCGHLGAAPPDEECYGVGIIDGGENGVLGLGLGFEYDGDENNNNNNNQNGINHGKEDGDDEFEYEEVDPIGFQSKKKRKKMKGSGKRMWAFLSNQFVQLREREAQFEDREVERERERQRREQMRMEVEQEREKKLEEREKEREHSREKMRRERIREWEAMEKESVERERRRREEELIMEREWEERMERRRLDWKKRMDDMLNQHRAAMEQAQSRILHDQQTVTSQLLGILSQWTGHPTGISDHTGAGNPYLSQMMQNMHHVNGIVHGENRVEGDNQDDQFIVDG